MATSGCMVIDHEVLHVQYTKAHIIKLKRLSLYACSMVNLYCILYVDLYVTVLEKRDHLATKIIFELCILSERGHCEL